MNFLPRDDCRSVTFYGVLQGKIWIKKKKKKACRRERKSKIIHKRVEKNNQAVKMINRQGTLPI